MLRVSCVFLAPMALALALPWAIALPAAAQELQPHRAAYAVSVLEKGKPGTDTPGTYAFELKQT